MIGIFSGSELPETQTMYGSIILQAKTGGYVLIAVLGFFLGVLVALIVKMLKKQSLINEKIVNE